MKQRSFRRWFVLTVISLSEPAFAQDAKLIDAAKKEGGKVIVYSSMESSISDGIAAAFKKKTGLEMEYWRGSSTKVLDRALSEHRAGKPLFDVAITIADPMFLMQSEGVFAKYESPSAADYPKSLIDPNLGPNYRTLLIGIVYNKNSIKPADAPKSFEDLVKPQFKGKSSCPIRRNTRRRRSGSPVCQSFWAKSGPTSLLATWRQQSRFWLSHSFRRSNAR